MDAHRFDTLTRTLGSRLTRRRVGGIVALGAALLARSARPASAQTACGSAGCVCSSDLQCPNGLICCAPGDYAGWSDGLCTVPGMCACTGEGCTCYPHTMTPCDRGLSCRAVSTPAAGVCTAAAIPAGACTSWGEWCPDSCAWGASCAGCCGGYCNGDGACDELICTAANCRCDTNDPFSCASGLTCVPVQQPLGSDLPGGVCM